MKTSTFKHLFLFGCLGLAFVFANAQCVPDPAYTASGVYPEVVPPACANIAYSTVLTVNVPQDTTVAVPPFGNITVPIDSIIIDNVTGIPTGLTYQCNPPSCVFTGGSSNCIEILGTPTVADTFTVQIMVSYYAVVFGSPQTLSSVETLEVIVYPSLTASLSVTNANCGASDGIATVTASGTAPITYSWSNGDTGPVSDNLAPGTYTVDVTDDNGCTQTLTANVGTSGNAPVITQDQLAWTGCAGSQNGSVMVTVSGGTPPYTFTWSNGASTEDLTGVGPGTYALTVNDASGCASSSSYTVVAPPALVLSAGQVDPVSCYGLNDGNATVTVSGGQGPYTYTWQSSPVQNTATAVGLAPGVIGVLVTDALGCVEDLDLTIMEPDSLELSLTSTNETQFGAANGTADLTIVGGTLPYTVSWSNGSTASSLSALAPGTYTVTVTDANGCSETGTVEIVGVNVSIEDELAAGFRELSLYPNPSQGQQVQLRIQLDQPESLQIELLNPRGQRLWIMQTLVSQQVDQVLELHALPAGLYVLRVSSAKGSTYRKLLLSE